MHDDRSLVERRLDRALRERIRPAVHAEATPLDVEVWHVPGEPVPVARALEARYTPFRPGDPWGPPWGTSWFRLRGRVPEGWAGRRVEAVIDLGFTGAGPGFQAEGLVYDAAGVPIKGVHPENRYVPVTAPEVDLLVEAAANPAIPLPAPTELGDILTAGDAPIYRFGRADLAVLDETVWHLTLDVEVLRDLMAELDVADPRRHEILRALERMLDALDLHDVGATAGQARAELAGVLARPAHASAHRVSAVGHAHIDSAWLWPLRETERKAARTFANVTRLAEDYPELVFACSQAQQYAWVKDAQPHVYRRIQEAVRAGTWVPVGSMWVESDANLPGGEALARQLVHGKRFFAEEFGVDTEEIWLPDSFGYTAAFPQLAKLAGVRFFLTQKLSWNQTNRFPHSTFWWEGIDGTRIFTHFPPADTYEARLEASELARAVRNFTEKGRGTGSLLPFGYGDGGGGPTREMLEKARRLRDLEGSPRVVVEPPAAFFERALAEYPDAPVWSGELYLELHRATYTTQARTKAGNRRSEHLLREAELWAATAAVRDGAAYPYEALDGLWKEVLLHQFHDILPGSSIAWVHREARAAYERIRVELEALIPGGAGPYALNAGPFDRDEVVTVDAGALPGAVQKLEGGEVAGWASAPALGAGPLTAQAPASVPGVRVTRAGDGLVLDNGLLRVEVDADGLLASVLDLAAGREALAPGARGNLLQLHPDHPLAWDAWDIDRHYLRRHTDLTDAEEVTVTDHGPLVATVRVTRRFGDSRITQRYRLRAGSGALEFDTEVDWRESEKVLKAAFPFDVHADRSTAEIQFGHVHRPTHTNTSWDEARFEIWAHRWLHVGEPGYGMALANDSTYGHDVRRGTGEAGPVTTVRLTLLRAPHSPDPRTDRDVHKMTYALVPGADVPAAIRAGYALNLPLRAAAADPGAPLVRVADPAAVVEAVKLADDGSGDVIVRLYESLGGRVATRLRPGFGVGRAQVADLLERPLADLPSADDGGIPITLRPFQVLTLRLTAAS
ncbi:alpha-mannosidase [Microtetraspora sp. NBRC 13810]|uniref:alpha-mannosidase n=1 Tax=Microtetraspora sp. NBRC 13810 TaxID=3030990 RepID=UPI0024A4E1F3|nr:glycoside hydrolase family 38 C-terminal domain-containing protein [Microtetraspora sp. NBRC 13810]GLW12300.1 alpha-mannosidase [Microtetraspora sp. NBRC 13810]